MRALPILVLALSILLGGCLDALTEGRDGAAAPGLGTTNVPQRFVWNMTACREIVATFDVDTRALQAALPEGFVARPGRTPGRTGAGIDIFECESASVTDGAAPGASYASFWTSVDAPEELMGNATGAFVKWDTLVTDPIALAALKEAGAPVRGGVATVRDVPPLGATAGEIRYEEIGRVGVSVLPEASRSSGGPGEGTILREWSPAGPEGKDLAMWEVTLVQWDDASAPGVIEVPSGSMAAKLYGSTRIPSIVGLGMADLRDGFMETNAPKPASK